MQTAPKEFGSRQISILKVIWESGPRSHFIEMSTMPGKTFLSERPVLDMTRHLVVDQPYLSGNTKQPQQDPANAAIDIRTSNPPMIFSDVLQARANLVVLE